MRIRPATSEDVDVVAALEESIFGADAWTPAMVAEELTGPRRRSFVAGEVAGYAVVLDGDVADLQRIAVAPAHRRRGIARALLGTAMEQATADRMLLEVSAANEAAIAFYQAAGFTEIARRERYYRDGTDAVVMEVQL